MKSGFWQFSKHHTVLALSLCINLGAILFYSNSYIASNYKGYFENIGRFLYKINKSDSLVYFSVPFNSIFGRHHHQSNYSRLPKAFE